MTAVEAVLDLGARPATERGAVAAPAARPRRFARFVKAGIDLVGALVLLLLVAPVFLSLALAVKLSSPGPVFFRQTRVGRNGKHFTFLKFRTMVDGAEQRLAELYERNESDGITFKMRFDPRVTNVGRLLRRYSLDELPQLLHVLRGHMSLVGPRPAIPSEVERYDDVVRQRLLVKPGLTGLWQVSGRSDLPWAQSVELDLRYVEGWSNRGDVVILAKTLPAVVSARGAY